MLLRLLTITTLLLSSTIFAQGSPELSIPATFKFDLRLPGEGNNFLRPARIFTDRSFHEVYIADPGNARILIFNEKGIFKYEFSVSEYMGSPQDVVVGSDGYITVLGSSRRGMRLFRFDFDGLYLGYLTTDEATTKILAGASSIAIDDEDRVYALVQSRGTVVRCGTDGKIDLEFSVAPEIDAEDQEEMVYGAMQFAEGYLYVPVSSLGSVHRFTTDGKAVGSFGIRGTLVGQMNFPVSVSVSTDGIIMVLDKHRFNVQCYDQNGRFLAEFGGKGTSPGWFYHPSWIAIDGSNQVYVGQIFNNRVQVLTIPQLIYERKSEVKGQAAQSHDANSEIGSVSGSHETHRRWSGNVKSTFDCVEDDILHDKMVSETTIPYNPLQLAFLESVGGIYNA